MQIPKLKSHSPKFHDNTESDVIVVTPNVLDNKLRDFEEHNKIRSSISSDIALAATLVVAIFTTTFKDFSFIKGSTIKGAFIIGLLVVLVKIGHSVYKIYFSDRNNRIDLINSLSKEKENKL